MSDEKYIIETVGDMADLLNSMADLPMHEMFFIANIDDELFCINKGCQRDIAELLMLMATEDPALAKIIKTVATLMPSHN